MKTPRWLPVLVLLGLSAGLAACRDDAPFSRAYPITHRAQIVGGPAALAELGDLILENDRIRIGIAKRGDSVGPGVFGGSIMDADVRRPEAAHRAGLGQDQLTEIFTIGNLSTPAVCLEGEKGKISEYCQQLPEGREPSVEILCDGSGSCELNLDERKNADYKDDGRVPSAGAAVIRVEAMSGNYLEALQLMSIASVKASFRMRTDYILEPGAAHIRIRTFLIETDADSGQVLHPAGEVVALPPLTRSTALFGILLGSDFFETELPNMQPGLAGGDFLFLGARLKNFAPNVGFDIYKIIRNKYAVGQDSLNDPVVSDFIAGVGDHVSYAIASADAEGRFLLPLYSGAVTAGYTHGAHCSIGPCLGTEEQCSNVLDCSNLRGVYFERLFAVGDGDVGSAAQALYQAWQTPRGQIKGHVYDRRSGEPVTDAQVHVYRVPPSMADCLPGGDPLQAYQGGAEGFVAQCLEPSAYLGAYSHFRTDRRLTDLPVGAFDGELPVGRYYLLAKKVHRPASQVVAVEITEGQSMQVALHLVPPARIQYEIVDESNQRIPAKLTIGQCFANCAGRWTNACTVDTQCAAGKCEAVPGAAGAKQCLVDNCADSQMCDLEQDRCIPRATCAGDVECGPLEQCLVRPGAEVAHCSCVPTFARQAAIGEGSYPAGLGRYAYSQSGFGEVEIEPGTYDVWASRGFEYSVSKQQLSLVSGQTALLTARLVREVDTSGWISADFHVHGQNSYDAVTRHRDQVVAFAGEGVEILTTTDHDYITDLAPYVHEMGLERWLGTQVGLELSTIELGHFLGFPYRYQEWQEGVRVQEQGAFDWTGKVPDRVFEQMHALGEFSPDETVVVVAHPRDSFFGYFDQYGMSSYDPNQVTGTLFEWLPPFVENPLADPALFSGRFDALELFNSKRFDLIRTPSAGELRHYNHQRAIIQAQADQGASPESVERQLVELDQVFVKDILRRTPAEQQAIWNSDGSEDCPRMDFCTHDQDCPSGWSCNPERLTCEKACTGDPDCGDKLCLDGWCDPGYTAADSPCTAHEGVVDDWFRLLDYGVVRTGIGNSDTHQRFTQTEAGCPRNFVKFSAESPKGFDRRELARMVLEGRVVTSYGPFVQLWIGDQELGGIYAAGSRDTVPMRIRVQSPSWFDVDRVEIYRSGELIHVLTGAGDELAPQSKLDTSGLQLPNPRVVNLDAMISTPVTEQDAWYVVIAMGLDGRDLTPVYSQHPYLKLQIGDVLSRSFSSVPVPFDLEGMAIPRVFRVLPYAVTNPVFLDVDGNGKYDAPHDSPEWADGAPDWQERSMPFTSGRNQSPLAAPADEAQSQRLRQLQYFMGRLHRTRSSN